MCAILKVECDYGLAHRSNDLLQLSKASNMIAAINSQLFEPVFNKNLHLKSYSLET